MKSTFLLLALALSAIAATTNTLFLTWDNDPDYDSNVTFYVYSQTNIALPVAGWLVATNLSYDQWTNNPSRKPGEAGRAELPRSGDRMRFYVVTASNLFGESDFSDAVSVRRLLPPSRLKIGVSSNP